MHFYRTGAALAAGLPAAGILCGVSAGHSGAGERALAADAASGPVFYAEVCVPALNVRSGPGTNSPVVQVLPRGSRVAVRGGGDGDWLRTDGGWVLSEGVECAAVPAAAAAPAGALRSAADAAEFALEADAVREDSSGIFYVRICAPEVSLHAGADADSAVAGTAEQGEVLPVLDLTEDGWCLLDSGYARQAYLDPVEVPSAAAGTRIEIPEPVSGSGEQAAELAEQYLGWRYVWGGSSPASGFDCSGFISWVYRQLGISLHRTASGQLQDGIAVSRSSLQPGIF